MTLKIEFGSMKINKGSLFLNVSRIKSADCLIDCGAEFYCFLTVIVMIGI